MDIILIGIDPSIYWDIYGSTNVCGAPNRGPLVHDQINNIWGNASIHLPTINVGR